MLKESFSNRHFKAQVAIVLILILMEHAQRAGAFLTENPTEATGLNPYFNGTCSKRSTITFRTPSTEVLILILMEHAQRANIKKRKKWRNWSRLNPYFNGTCSKRLRTQKACCCQMMRCLNPYFNGTCSKSLQINIVIYMEYKMS